VSLSGLPSESLESDSQIISIISIILDLCSVICEFFLKFLAINFVIGYNIQLPSNC